MKKFALVSVIDDDRSFQFSAKKILESISLIDKVLQFEDGEQAIDYFLENKDVEDKIPDLVFLDLNMPFMNGWEFIDEFIKISFKKESVIYISTSSNILKDVEKFRSYPALKGYLIKPIVREEFARIVQEELTWLN